MQLTNITAVLREEDLVSLRCGDDIEKLQTLYFDKKLNIVIKFDENNGRTICYRGYKDGYLFVINKKNRKEKNEAKLIKLDSDLKQTLLYEADRILDADDFSDGRIPRDDSLRVIKDGRLGCINLDGNEIIKPQYKRIMQFKNGLAIAYNDDDKAGIINKQNEVIIPFKYDELGSGFCEMLDEKGNSVNCIFAANEYKQNEKYPDFIVHKFGIINDKCEEIIPFEYDDIIMCQKPSKIFAAQKEGLWGFVDINNNIVIPFEYNQVNCIYENKGIFIVTKGTKERKMGIIDCNAKTIIPCEYAYLKVKSENLIIAEKQNGKFVLLNYNNEEISDEYEVISDEYDDITRRNIKDKTIFAVKKDDKYGYINQQGEVVIPFKYNYAEDFKGGIAIADNTIINEKGEVLFETYKNANIRNLEIGIIYVEREHEKRVYDLIKIL